MNLLRPARLLGVFVLASLSACGGGGRDESDTSSAALPFVAQMRAQSLASATASERTGAAATVRAAAAAPAEVTADWVLDWAEFKFPQLFPNAVAQRFPAVVYEGTTYNARAYSGAWGTRYLGITPDGRIFGMGDFTANALKSFETLGFWSTQVLADACAVYPGPCAPVRSPLSGRAWEPVLQLAQGISDRPLVAMADDGRAVVVAVSTVTVANSPLRQAAPFVMLGDPAAEGAAQWSAPVPLSTLGSRRAGSAPINLRVFDLRMSPNGRAVMLAMGDGGDCPQRFAGFNETCSFVSVLDPVLRTWSPWDPIAPASIGRLSEIGTVAINDRGDLAVYSSPNEVDAAWRLYWRTASDTAFRSFQPPPRQASLGTQAARFTLDESGGLVLAAGLGQNSTTDIAVWRGNVTTGMQAPAIVDTRASPASFRSLWTGRSGRSFLLWSQSNGTTTSLWGARFDRSTISIAAIDLGASLLSELPTSLLGAVDDNDMLIAPRFNGRQNQSSCDTLRWPFAGAVELAVGNPPCSLAIGIYDPSSEYWASARNGSVLSVIQSRGFAWATYDAQLNAQVQAPLTDTTITSGPGYVTGVRSQTFLNTTKTVLSNAGIGLTVITADLDVWPTPSAPTGDGRPGVRNLWATFFK